MKPNPVEKRIRKELRLKKPLRKGEKVLVLGDLCSYLLGTITSLPLTIVKMKESSFGIKKMDESVFSNKKLKRFVKKNKISKVVVPWTMDDEILYFLNCVFENKKPVFLGHRGKFVKLLISVDKEDAIKYAKKRAIRYNAGEKEKLEMFVNEMGSRYKETKYSLLATAEEFSELI